MTAKTPNKGISARAMVLVMAALTVLVVATVSTAWSQTAQAKEPQTNKKQIPKKEEPTVSVSGQKVAIDPQTKKLRQLTPEESQALSEDLKNYFGKTPGELKIYQYPNGMLAAELPEEYMDSMVVKRNPDGTLTTECVRGVKSAAAQVQVETANPAKSNQGASKPKVDEKAAGKKPDKTIPKPSLEEKE